MEEPYLKCSICEKTYSYQDAIWCCAHCGGPLNIIYSYEPFSSKKIIEKELGLFKYRNYLPPVKNKFSLGEGDTPLVKTNIKNFQFYFKLDYLMPTGSFKDRGSFLTISHVADLGIKRIVEDSSGNAGISIAAYAKFAGLNVEIHGPIDMPEGKVRILKNLGVTVFLAGDRMDAHKRAISSKYGYYVGHLYNPFFLEGMKTVAYELYLSGGPDVFNNIVVPIGSGTLLLGLWKGIKDLMDAGLIDNVKILGVEAAGYEEVYKKLYGEDAGYEKTEIADGLRVYKKPRIKEIIDIIRKFGDVVVVNRDMIWLAYDELWNMGFLVEPSSAAGYAGAKYGIENKLIDEPITVILTGSGIKL